MVAIGTVPPVYANGEGKRIALFRLSGVKSGDSFDVQAELRRVDHADAYALSANVKALVPATATAGTVITFTDVNLDSDVVYLLVGGAAA